MNDPESRKWMKVNEESDNVSKNFKYLFVIFPRARTRKCPPCPSVSTRSTSIRGLDWIGNERDIRQFVGAMLHATEEEEHWP